MKKKPLTNRFTKRRLERDFLRRLERAGAPPLLVAASRQGVLELHILRLGVYPGLDISDPAPVGVLLAGLVRAYAETYQRKFKDDLVVIMQRILEQTMDQLEPELAMIQMKNTVEEGGRIDH